MILAIKTDNPTAELIVLDDDGHEIAQQSWLAERRLARELLGKLEELLSQTHHNWEQLTGLVVFQGPGSFTGLRIGLTVMNTIAYGAQVPIVGTEGDNWLETGVRRLLAGEDDRIVLPEYGAPARITQPKK